MQLGSYAYGAVELGGEPIPIVVPTPPAAKRFTLFIAGVDRTSLMLVNTLRGVNNLSQVSTCTFTLYDLTGSFHATIGQDIQIFSNTTKIFGGTIDEVSETAYQALKGVQSYCKCSDYSAILDRRIVGNFYTGFSMSTIVSDLVQKFLSADGIIYNSTDGDPGTTLGDQLFNWVTARQAFQQLSSATGWDFNVDYSKNLRFFPANNALGTAPFNIADNDGNVLAQAQQGGTSGGTNQSASIRYYRGTYMNRVYVRSSAQPQAVWGDTFSAAIPGPYPSNKQAPGGGRIFFVTLFQITATPTVLKNNVAQRVIPLSQVAGAAPGSYDFYWIPNGYGVVAAVAPISTDVIVVNYQTKLSPVTTVTCAAQVTARSSAEGNSGYYDAVLDAPNITDPAAISNYATTQLNRYGCTFGIPNQVIYSTTRDGLFAGQIQTINLTQPLVTSAPYLISAITWRDVDKDHIEYSVTCDTGAYQGDNYIQYFSNIVNRGQMPQPQHFETYTSALSPTVQGVANPGFGGTGFPVAAPLNQIIRNQAEVLQYISVFCPSNRAPQNDVTIQLIINTTGSIFVVFKAGTTGEQRAYVPVGSIVKLLPGDVMNWEVFVSPSASNMYDVTASIVTSVAVA